MDHQIVVFVNVAGTEEQVIVDLEAPVAKLSGEPKDLRRIDDVPSLDRNCLTGRYRPGREHAEPVIGALLHNDFWGSPNPDRCHQASLPARSARR